MNRKRFFSLCAAAMTGALIPVPVVRAGSPARIDERFHRMWSNFGQYRAGTPGIGEREAWAEKSLLRTVAREMERLKREILRELAPGKREEGQ